MELAAVFHDVNKQYCYAVDKNTFLIRLRAKKGDLAKVILHYQDKHIPREFLDTHCEQEMIVQASDEHVDYFECIISMDAMCIRYYFELIDQTGKTVFYSKNEFVDMPFSDVERMFNCTVLLKEQERFLVPEWAKNKVIYQIFPSRYATDREVSDVLWYKAPISFSDELHGNIRGIIEHLDHLEELGADVIYLTPIFRSPSCHKYDTVDYYQIDPDFGTKDDLKELVKKAHRKGMRVILDAVFNHTSPDFFAFSDVKSKEWESHYIDWYHVNDFPLRAKRGEKANYKCFGYYGGMPKLNLENPETEEYFIEVALYWLKEAGIDGWRLDVADEISHRFWKTFRRRVKEVNPDALIIGEMWYCSEDFLEGDEWDSVMNYPFYYAVKDFVADGTITASQFAGKLGFLRGYNNMEVYSVLVNLIDSHDTPRFLHLCGSKAKQKLAAALLLLRPGMPMIYYGDEYGMEGGTDPDNRRGMYWDGAKQDADMFSWYKKLIRLRKEYPEITREGTERIFAEDKTGILIITKESTERKIIMIFHNQDGEADLSEIFSAGEYAQIKGVNVMNQENFTGKVGAYEAAVLVS